MISTARKYKVIFSDRLKTAVVKLLYKKGFKTSMTNCSTISLVTVFFSEVFEKATCSTLSNHLHTNSLLI